MASRKVENKKRNRKRSRSYDISEHSVVKQSGDFINKSASEKASISKFEIKNKVPQKVAKIEPIEPYLNRNSALYFKFNLINEADTSLPRVYNQNFV